MSLLVMSEILRLFINTLTADDSYFVHNKEHLRQLIQMQFSKKQKSFYQNFGTFLKFTSNFEQFEKKNDSHSICISEITYWQRGDQINV